MKVVAWRTCHRVASRLSKHDLKPQLTTSWQLWTWFTVAAQIAVTMSCSDCEQHMDFFDFFLDSLFGTFLSLFFVFLVLLFFHSGDRAAQKQEEMDSGAGSIQNKTA